MKVDIPIGVMMMGTVLIPVAGLIAGWLWVKLGEVREQRRAKREA